MTINTHSFVEKVLLKKIFFEKIFVFFIKYTLFAEKVFLYGKKNHIEKCFCWKKLFYRERYLWKCMKYISHMRNVFLGRKYLFYKQNVNLS